MSSAAARLNILAISYLFPNRANPGYGVFVLNRLKAVQQFCNVKVIAPVQWYPFINRLKGSNAEAAVPAVENIQGIDTSHPRFAVVPRYLKWIDCLTFLWATLRAFRALRGRFDFDLVDVHWTYPDVLAGYWLARRHGKKFIVTIRGHEAFYDEETSIRRWIVAQVLRRADYVVALSSELREKVIRLGVPAVKTRVILNGVDLAQFAYISQEDCRQRLGLPANRKVLVSVGRLTERKGHHLLIQILPTLARIGPVDLFIIGGVNREDDYGPVLQAMIADLKLTNVHLLDRVPHEDLRYWYGAADAFCLATMSEGCPNVILEALACGAPVVATGAGAIRDLVATGEDGIVVDRPDVASLGAAVRNALETGWDRQRIAARMQSRSWASCAQQVVDVYRTLLH